MTAGHYGISSWSEVAIASLSTLQDALGRVGLDLCRITKHVPYGDHVENNVTTDRKASAE